MKGPIDVEVRREDLRASVVQQLIDALDTELTGRYPEDSTAAHFQLDAEEVSEERGAFFLAYLDGDPVGCGGLRRIESGVAEIKRMYVVPGARSRGIGRQILNALEAEARRLGVRRLVLETGPRQPEAIALYRRAGFSPIPLFGEYLAAPHPEFSVCMAKDL
jgi:putative acetyltransferase